MRHKHADLIHAWAEGAEIEGLDGVELPAWRKLDLPLWNPDFEYRIKPEKKPDVVRYTSISLNTDRIFQTRIRDTTDKLKLTFDGETFRLIKAEVLNANS